MTVALKITVNKKHEKIYVYIYMLIIFNDMIGDMINNKKLNLAVTELFIRSRK